MDGLAPVTSAVISDQCRTVMGSFRAIKNYRGDRGRGIKTPLASLRRIAPVHRLYQLAEYAYDIRH